MVILYPTPAKEAKPVKVLKAIILFIAIILCWYFIILFHYNIVIDRVDTSWYSNIQKSGSANNIIPHT